MKTADPSSRPDPLADADKICRLSAAELSRAFADRSLSPVEATRAALARAETIHRRFNALTVFYGDELLAVSTMRARCAALSKH